MSTVKQLENYYKGTWGPVVQLFVEFAEQLIRFV